MEKSNLIRIIIADDHPVVLEGLVALIGRPPDMVVVGEASNGQEAVAAFRQSRPDITLMDLRMPGMDGFEAIAAIREMAPAARVIVLTTYDDEEGIKACLLAGAKAYLLKDVPRHELLTCIRAVHEGRTAIPAPIAEKLVETLAQPPLTDREIEVLQLVYDGGSNKEIAALLFISEGTVKSHLHALLSKLQARDRTQAVAIALRRGLLRVQ